MSMYSSSVGSEKRTLYNIKQIFNKPLDVIQFKENKQYFHTALQRGDYKTNDKNKKQVRRNKFNQIAD